MTNEEKAELNYLLTKLRCQIEDFIADSNIVPCIEEKYTQYIDMINTLLQVSYVEGDDK